MTYADRLAELSDHGVSICLDSLSRGRRRGGGLAALVRDRHVVGVTGLEQAATAGVDLTTIRSVASLFVSRVDTEMDSRLDKIGTVEAQALRGKSGIANARLAYEHYEALIASPRWRQLEARGATRQRPLWASTGVKTPAYPDTMYVTQLVAPDTVNTMPEATLDAVADHAAFGTDTIRSGYEEAAALLEAVLEALPHVGVDYEDVTSTLERDGVQKFVDFWTDLLANLQAVLFDKTEHRSPMRPR